MRNPLITISMIITLSIFSACNHNDTDSSEQQSHQEILKQRFDVNSIAVLSTPKIVSNNQQQAITVWQARTNSSNEVNSGIYLSKNDKGNWSQPELIAAVNVRNANLQAISNGSDFLITWTDSVNLNALIIKPTDTGLNDSEIQQVGPPIDADSAIGSIFTDLAYTRVVVLDSQFVIASNSINGVGIFIHNNGQWSQKHFDVPRQRADFYPRRGFDFTATDDGVAIAWVDKTEDDKNAIFVSHFNESTNQWSDRIFVTNATSPNVLHLSANSDRYMISWVDNFRSRTLRSKLLNPINASLSKEITTQHKFSIHEVNIVSANEKFYSYFNSSCDMQALDPMSLQWNQLSLTEIGPFQSTIREKCSPLVTPSAIILATEYGLETYDHSLNPVSLTDSIINADSDVLDLYKFDESNFGVLHKNKEQQLLFTQVEDDLASNFTTLIGSLTPPCSLQQIQDDLCLSYRRHDLHFSKVNQNIRLTWISIETDSGQSMLHIGEIKNGQLQKDILFSTNKPYTTDLLFSEDDY